VTERVEALETVADVITGTPVEDKYYRNFCRRLAKRLRQHGEACSSLSIDKGSLEDLAPASA
jgi:hypothetical protein